MTDDPNTPQNYTLEDGADVAPHPEAMVSEFEFSAGKYIHFRARTRFTPASLFAMGITTVAILLAVVPVIRAKHRRY